MRMAKPDKMVLKMFIVRQNTLISPICKTKKYFYSLKGRVRGPFLWETEHLFLVHELVMDPKTSIFSWALTSPCTNTFRAMQDIIRQQKIFILWACLVLLGLQCGWVNPLSGGNWLHLLTSFLTKASRPSNLISLFFFPQHTLPQNLSYKR